MNKQQPGAISNEGEGSVIQFNWRKNWKKRVAPHLTNDYVQLSIDLGMRMLDPGWERGDVPWLVGCGPLNGQRARPGKLSWYQPWARCHWIAFFSLAIGVLNYPGLDWRFVSGERHTVPVGYLGEEPRVVMDLLHFARLTAEESLDLAQAGVGNEPEASDWPTIHAAFINHMVPLLKKAS